MAEKTTETTRAGTPLGQKKLFSRVAARAGETEYARRRVNKMAQRMDLGSIRMYKKGTERAITRSEAKRLLKEAGKGRMIGYEIRDTSSKNRIMKHKTLRERNTAARRFAIMKLVAISVG
jgi:hypothetical protein